MALSKILLFTIFLAIVIISCLAEHKHDSSEEMHGDEPGKERVARQFFGYPGYGGYGGYGGYSGSGAQAQAQAQAQSGAGSGGGYLG